MDYDLVNMNDEQLLELLEQVWDNLSEAGKDDAEEKIGDLNDGEGGV
ncbi:hypothetical protein LCGC14_0771510 [marine sediment metagenome]|uniref:Uncharacterized protein n=1 Tax=marine sediment metagenome TaxID=412755 RepID=A0A0F9T4Y3_9ZZZZ